MAILGISGLSTRNYAVTSVVLIEAQALCCLRNVFSEPLHIYYIIFEETPDPVRHVERCFWVSTLQTTLTLSEQCPRDRVAYAALKVYVYRP